MRADLNREITDYKHNYTVDATYICASRQLLICAISLLAAIKPVSQDFRPPRRFAPPLKRGAIFLGDSPPRGESPRNIAPQGGESPRNIAPL